GANDGGNPANFIQGGDGNFYGVAGYPNVASLFKVTPAGVRTTVLRFEGNNGTQPSQLLASSDGNIYGTTQNGGPLQAGIVFAVTPSGLVNSYSFDGVSTGGNP